MHSLVPLKWDSDMFGSPVAKVADYRTLPTIKELSQFKFIHVRIPQDQISSAAQYQGIGFKFILLDNILEKIPNPSSSTSEETHQIVRISKQSPAFGIKGFNVSGSRLSVDPELSKRLKNNYWDEVIYQHCSEYADFALCALESSKDLVGFTSCFDHSDSIDIFLLAVRPDYTQHGLGTALIKHLENTAHSAGKMLTTSVVSPNYDAINFYFKQGFQLQTAFIVMHYSNPRIG